MLNLHLSLVSDGPGAGSVEMVERKGLGHPDTICDALAENLSRNLCAYYRQHFGQILHHNVDKALLCGGKSRPRFGGGRVDEPIEIYLAGRAASQVAKHTVPLAELAIDGSRTWLRENLPALDVDKHVRLHCLVRPGSADLVSLFGSGRGAVPLANDTSFGVGYAPLSALERLVRALDLERSRQAAWGQDTKVMAVRTHDRVQVTVACAMIDAHLSSAADYQQATEQLRRELHDISTRMGIEPVSIQVNTADDVTAGRFFLTVTGTSAEAGDDGQVGRGNRANGLITPYRPMSLEALAGKNPVNHVGKLYNVVAARIAAALVGEIDDVSSANCALLSQIGRPINDPLVADVGVHLKTQRPMQQLRPRIQTLVQRHLDELGTLSERFVAGEFELF